MDEMKLLRQRGRGAEAKRLEENSLIKEFFTNIENAVRDAWTNSAGDEVVIRERAYLMMRLAANFRQQFKSSIYTGEIASRELLEIEPKAKEAGK